MQNSMRIGVEVTSSLHHVCWDWLVIGTADFQPIEIFVRHGIDDVTHPMGKHQFCLRLQIVCREDRTTIESGRDYPRHHFGMMVSPGPHSPCMMIWITPVQSLYCVCVLDTGDQWTWIMFRNNWNSNGKYHCTLSECECMLFMNLWMSNLTYNVNCIMSYRQCCYETKNSTG